MATLPTVVVTGTLYDADHELYDGPIYFSKPILLKHSDGTAELPNAVPTRIDVVNGVVAAELLYVDAPGWGPTGWSWRMDVPRGSVTKSYSIAPSVDDPDDVNLGDLMQPFTPSLGNDFALAGHTHPTDVSDAELTTALNALKAELSGRIVDVGELVLPREQEADDVQLTTGRMFVTHFTALTTETILNVKTTCRAAGVGSQHAWVGFMRWTPGVGYTLDSVSVDDPTRWTNTVDYPTLLFQTDDAHFGAADLARPGFFKVAGQRYIEFTLWVGAGAGPKLAGHRVEANNAFYEPRQNGYMDLVAPPSSMLQPQWLVGSPFRVQGVMQR